MPSREKIIEPIGYVMENYAEFYAKYGQTILTPEIDKFRIPVYLAPPSALAIESAIKMQIVEILKSNAGLISGVDHDTNCRKEAL